MSTFQIVVLGIFASLILIGVGVFAAFGGMLGGGQVGAVTVWGTLDRQTMDGLIDALRSSGDKAFESVTYVEKDPATYRTDLINSMAAGQGPDLFLVSGEDLYTFSDKVLTIPYNIISQGSYQATYIDAGQLFLTSDGELALPFLIDPIVMYWNRDLFASAGLSTPPVYWDEFLTIAPKITALDSGSNVKKSAVALGEWRNIPTAKEILSALFMQTGDTIVSRYANGLPNVTLGTTPDGATSNPAESALRFYTEFANPSKTSYAWNRSLPSAPDMFTSGGLGVYFGYASEYQGITERNPNLRFGVAGFPQIQGNSTRVTYGRIMGLAISRSAKNVQGALTVAQHLAGKQSVALISGALSLPPVRRDVAVDTSNNAAAAAFVQSSLIARGWLEPSDQVDDIFETMIESVVSGQETPSVAIADAVESMRQLFPKQ
jgi:multiple sugar transport system substrate-binding protein